MKVHDLSEIQRQHLAWRLDAKTPCGYITACFIARGQGKYKEMDLVEIFEWVGQSKHSAKIHARKVMNFKLTTSRKGTLNAKRTE